MVMTSRLSPTLFYLQDFNQYHVLALTASEMGNMTLVGRNTAGKTTLANCFYPMLIDGSIATPSFNAAKGTEKLDQSTTVRNSKQDSRTFESMLLGFGPGAKKVRTGYSCMLLKSAQRQVILGIGAHRATDGSRSKTWWFVAIDSDPNHVISLITTDAEGRSLEKEAFIQQNEVLGEQLHVFSRADDYRAFVAKAVYEFEDVESLAKLANTYRLLASPILTGGNARFQPILAALKEAQEPIDAPGIIYLVADMQRKLNQQQALLSQIKSAQNRLQRIKSVIFWGNLNGLKTQHLNRYTDLDDQIQSQQTALIKIAKQITEFQEQIHLTQTSINHTQTKIDALAEQQRVQKTIQERRNTVIQKQTFLHQQLEQYRRQQQQLADLNQELMHVNTDYQQNEQRMNQIEQQQLTPILTVLNSRSATYTQLGRVLAEVDRQTQLSALQTYLSSMNQEMMIYQNRQTTMLQLTASIKIVNGMQTQMGEAIDKRLQGPFVARSREELQIDNLEIHQRGAGQMSDEYNELVTEEQQQLVQQPDLKLYLTDEDAVNQLRDTIDDYENTLGELTDVQQKQAQLTHDQGSIRQQIQRLEEALIADFNEADTLAELDHLTAELETLVVDSTIGDRLRTAKQNINQFQEQLNHFSQQLNQAIGSQKTTQEQLAGHQSELQTELTLIENALVVLLSYNPEKIKLKTVSDVLTFEQSNRSKIRQNPSSDVGVAVRDAINGSTAHQIRIEINALDTIFEQRGYSVIASEMRQQRTTNEMGMTVVAFDINEAIKVMQEDEQRLTEAVNESQKGNDVAIQTYTMAVIHSIVDQYKAVATYNEMLAEGQRADGIQIRIELHPQLGTFDAINEARDAQLDQRPALRDLILSKIGQFTNDETLANDDDAFFKAAKETLDTRDWSVFQVMIHRRQSRAGEFEVVDDTFVRSGGSGAEKAQAMVLPLLLVPKMILGQAKRKDAPHVVMFDEFADKLDADTAKVFAQTISRFGFSFIATMPSGGQTKVLADGVENLAWEVLAPQVQNDGKFHTNQVRPALVWR